MSAYLIFDKQSGHVSCSFIGDDPKLATRINETYIESQANPGNVYICDGKVSRRPEMHVKSKPYGYSGIPSGTLATIRYKPDMTTWGPFDNTIRETSVIKDGTLNLSVSRRGRYQIHLRCFPFLDENITYTNP